MIHMKKIILFSLLCCVSFISVAQELAVVSQNDGFFRKNPIESHLFKPEDVMKHQRALSLSQQQKNNIIAAHQEAQSEFAKWQWDLQAISEEMTELVSKTKIDESKAMQTLEKMLDLERNIKRTQLRLMIKIKNQLNKEQQEKLRELTTTRYPDLLFGTAKKGQRFELKGYEKNKDEEK